MAPRTNPPSENVQQPERLRSLEERMTQFICIRALDSLLYSYGTGVTHMCASCYHSTSTEYSRERFIKKRNYHAMIVKVEFNIEETEEKTNLGCYCQICHETILQLRSAADCEGCRLQYLEDRVRLEYGALARIIPGKNLYIGEPMGRPHKNSDGTHLLCLHKISPGPMFTPRENPGAYNYCEDCVHKDSDTEFLKLDTCHRLALLNPMTCLDDDEEGDMDPLGLICSGCDSQLIAIRWAFNCYTCYQTSKLANCFLKPGINYSYLTHM